jgi:hypothetical protein
VRQREPALITYTALLEHRGEDLAGIPLKEQAVAQQLRYRGVGIDDLHFVSHSAAAQQIVEHQSRLDRCDAALVGTFGVLGKVTVMNIRPFSIRVSLSANLRAGPCW